MCVCVFLLFLFLFHNLAELENENELTSPRLLPDPAFVPVSVSLPCSICSGSMLSPIRTDTVCQVWVELQLSSAWRDGTDLGPVLLLSIKQ